MVLQAQKNFPPPTVQTTSKDSSELYVFDTNFQWEGIYDSHLKTLTFRSIQDWYSYPVLDLHFQKSYLIEFDDFREEQVEYYYRLIHCNRDWTPSELDPLDYMDGFTEGPLDDYYYSHTLSHRFIHYQLLFPRQDSHFKVSGNYLLEIYPYHEPQRTVLSKRMVVIENLLTFDEKRMTPAFSRYHRTHQSLRFTVDFTDAEIAYPMTELKATILQNGRWDNALTDIIPSYYDSHRAYYNLQDQYFFKGGREFRYVDLINLVSPHDNVLEKQMRGDTITIILKTDSMATNQPYSMKRDLNGRFYIGKKRKLRDWMDEEYIQVNFSLAANKPFENANVYIRGELSSWCLNNAYKMRYNRATANYEASLLLKQGIYNYQYVLSRDGSQEIDDFSLEGNYWNTENDYLIFIYQRPFNGHYDRVIGFTKINSFGP